MSLSIQELACESRAEFKVIEPQGMTQDELLEWYAAQPLPFRRRHRERMVELSTDLLLKAILEAGRELGRIPAAH